MERIKAYINYSKLAHGGPDWPQLESLIREVIGPGVDEIRAALTDLSKQPSPDGHYSIVLWDDGSSTIRLNRDHIRDCINDVDAVAKIRSLIPPPEPTSTSDLALIHKYVADRCGEGWADVMGAIKRLQETK